MADQQIIAFLPGPKQINISFVVGPDGNFLVNPETGAADVQIGTTDPNIPALLTARLLMLAAGAALDAAYMQGGNNVPISKEGDQANGDG